MPYGLPNPAPVDGGSGHLSDHVQIETDLAGIGAVVPAVTGGLTGATAATRYVGGTASGAPASGTFAAGDYVVTQNGHVFVCTAPGSPGTWADAGSSSGVSTFNSRSGAVTPGNADYLAVPTGGLTGATTATRYVGGTASAAPASGTFATGDFVIAQNGQLFICTAGGTPGTWARSNNPLTTAGDLMIMNSTPALARLAAGSANQVLGVAGGLPAWQAAYTRQTATANAGYTMVNSTGTIITFTTPNDGNVHSVQLVTLCRTTSAMTGGRVDLTFTDPSGAAVTFTAVLAGAFGSNTTNTDNFTVMASPNTAVSIIQGTAMSAGAAKVWAELWCA